MFFFREPSINNPTIIGKFRLQRTQAVFTVMVFSLLTVAVSSSGRAEDANGDVKLPDRDQQKNSEKAPDERLTKPGVAVEDQLVALAVENELLTADAISPHQIDASCRSGVVTLSGRVDHLLARERAAELAQRVKGVLSVVNQIVVIKGGRDDSDVANDVRSALLENPVTEAGEVQVDIQRGVATLTGSVNSLAEKRQAALTAASVHGVREIENNLEVQFSTDRPDNELQEEIQMMINSAIEIDDADVTVRVADGEVVLTGVVGSAYEKTVAERKTWIHGVSSVDALGLRIDFEHHDGTRRHQRMLDVTDPLIEKTVRLAFQHDPRLVSHRDGIEISSERGQVTLTGTVGRLRAKMAAESIARSTVGVWRVKNHLKVRWPEETPDDREIAATAIRALRRDAYVERHEIRVRSRNAHVHLYGMVDDEFEKRRAEWTVGGIAGVVHVANYLSVVPKWSQKSDDEIQADIEEKLKFTFFDPCCQVDVKVDGGVAILTGTVDSWMQWQRALDIAVAAGSRHPHNQVKVRYRPSVSGRSLYVPR